MTGVIVSHPHAAAVASELAAALRGADMLSAYFTGVAAAPDTPTYALLERLAQRHPTLQNRLITGVQPAALRPMWSVEFLARAASHVASVAAYDAMFTLHDAAVAVSRWPGQASAVYAFEDGALRTFRAAARRGLTRIWDLPLPHWATLERMWEQEAKRWPGAIGRAQLEPEWKKSRKDQELGLADVVSVASRFVSESLESAGCRKPILENAYGFPTHQFRQRVSRPVGPFTVLAVGTHDLRKGTPYLLEAWRRLHLRDARLKLIGPLRLGESLLGRYRGTFEHVPHLPRARLEAEYASADLLAFPTLGDGFGLVILESMSCGTPVLTTRCGGGPACITNDVDGWIVPERDVDALAERILHAASDRERTWSVGLAARQRAERWPVETQRRTMAAALRPYA